MTDYKELVKDLRYCADGDEPCPECRRWKGISHRMCEVELHKEAAKAIEELLKAAKAMHTWIFLHTADEQEAYDECHLSDEMNAALGYGGQFELRSPDERRLFHD